MVISPPDRGGVLPAGPGAAAGERLIEAYVTQVLTAVPSGPGRSSDHEDRPARTALCCA